MGTSYQETRLPDSTILVWDRISTTIRGPSISSNQIQFPRLLQQDGALRRNGCKVTVSRCKQPIHVLTALKPNQATAVLVVRHTRETLLVSRRFPIQPQKWTIASILYP